MKMICRVHTLICVQLNSMLQTWDFCERNTSELQSPQISQEHLRAGALMSLAFLLT